LDLTPWRAEAGVNKPTQKRRTRKHSKCITFPGALTGPSGAEPLARGLESLDPIAVVVLLAAIFKSDMASGAFSVPACATSDPPPPELLDPITIAVFLAAAFGSDVGAVAS
jgi:hypothetical protein